MSYLKSKKSTHKKKLLHKKRTWLFFITAIVVCVYFVFFNQNNSTPTLTNSFLPAQLEKPLPEAPLPPLPKKFNAPAGSIFVPYWKVSSLREPYLPDTTQHSSVKNLIYFGVTPDENGALDKSEPGYTNIATFAQKTVGAQQKKLLTLRMMDEDVTEAILGNIAHQDNLIKETLALAEEYQFDGIALDLEHSVLPTKDVIQQITTFMERTASKTHEKHLIFAATLYGDTFYRQRPYDVQKIASFSDQILIMAYDFHKSYGEPGPNFPLFKEKLYPYDFAEMIEDFTKIVPADKITVLFGLFGYDWSVDDQNRPAKSAKSLSLDNIETTILARCNQIKCKKSRNISTQEMNITYTETSGQRHSVWYEDSLSIQAKVSFLSTKNIHSIGYWAYGYY